MPPCKMQKTAGQPNGRALQHADGAGSSCCAHEPAGMAQDVHSEPLRQVGASDAPNGSIVCSAVAAAGSEGEHTRRRCNDGEIEECLSEQPVLRAESSTQAATRMCHADVGGCAAESGSASNKTWKRGRVRRSLYSFMMWELGHVSVCGHRLHLDR